jgi:RNA polymerase sigma-70 factor (ECF subfamily)
MGMDGERALIAAVRRDAPDAVAELFRLHWRGLWRAAFVIVGDSAIAEDIAQDAFLSALAALDRFDPRRPFAPWARRIAVNRAIDELRRRERAGGALPESEPWADDLGDDQRELLAALRQLRPERQLPILLHHLLGYSIDEVAELLAIPSGTAASRIGRGIGELRTTMELQRAD